MERISVGLPVAGEDRTETYDFDAIDAQAMLSWLEHEIHARNTPLYRNGQYTAQLRRLGRGSNTYWLIVPD